jgi:hypothetical protein
MADEAHVVESEHGMLAAVTEKVGIVLDSVPEYLVGELLVWWHCNRMLC